MVEGVKPVRELLLSNLQVRSVFATEQLNFLPDETVKLSEKELGRISGMKTANKVLAVAHIPVQKSPNWNSHFVLLLDGIKDPGNLGTIIRTAKWFGISDIICSTDSVDAYDRKVVQSTMGALFHINISYEDSIEAMRQAEQNQFTTVGTSMHGTSIFDTELAKKTLLIIGSESHGMRAEVIKACNKLCSIPNFENERKIESLNAGVATAVILAALTRKTLF